ARRWREARLKNVNVSLDTLDSSLFQTITGRDLQRNVLDGSDAAPAAGIEPVEPNAVPLKGVNGTQLDEFVDLARRLPVSVRFIELMRTGDNQAYFERHHLAMDAVRQSLQARGWLEVPRLPGAGPAVVLGHPDFQGSVGLIAPYSRDFC